MLSIQKSIFEIPYEFPTKHYLGHRIQQLIPKLQIRSFKNVFNQLEQVLFVDFLFVRNCETIKEQIQKKTRNYFSGIGCWITSSGIRILKTNFFWH